MNRLFCLCSPAASSLPSSSRLLKCIRGFSSSLKPRTGPLRGLRVLDLSRVLAGPYCCQMLGDLGADVIKVEQPGGGDETRRWGPPFIQGESSYFLSLNRNKRSIVVNLKSPEGVNIIKELIKVSDVVVENFLTNKMEELGLGYDELKKINNRLVFCSISGFGSSGPRASSPGYDALISAMYGMLHITGEPNGKAVKPGVAITDVLTGILAQGAILAALREVSITGQGQKVETSLMEAQLSSLVNIASNFLTTGVDNSKRYGTAHPSIVPYQSFQCSGNKEIMICIGSNKQYEAFCNTISRPDLFSNPKYCTNELRVRNRVDLISELESVLITKSVDDWIAIFEGNGFPFGPIQSIQGAFEDPQAKHRQMTLPVDHPACGPINLVGFPVKYSNTPCDISLPPPLLGMHTKEVMVETLGMSDTNIEELIKKGVLFCS